MYVTDTGGDMVLIYRYLKSANMKEECKVFKVCRPQGIRKKNNVIKKKVEKARDREVSPKGAGLGAFQTRMHKELENILHWLPCNGLDELIG